MKTARKKTSKAAIEKQQTMIATAPIVHRTRKIEIPASREPIPRLRVGDVFHIGSQGGTFIVLRVSPCSASAIPINTGGVTWKDIDGKTQFLWPCRTLNVSPNSEVEISRRMNMDDLKSHFSGSQPAQSAEITKDSGQTETTEQTKGEEVKKTNQTAVMDKVTKSKTPTAASSTKSVSRHKGDKGEDKGEKSTNDEDKKTGKGSLIGRGQMVRDLAAKGLDLPEFTTKIQAKYPASSDPWCAMQLKRALARIQKETAETETKPEPKAKSKGKKSGTETAVAA